MTEVDRHVFVTIKNHAFQAFISEAQYLYLECVSYVIASDEFTWLLLLTFAASPAIMATLLIAQKTLV